MRAGAGHRARRAGSRIGRALLLACLAVGAAPGGAAGEPVSLPFGPVSIRCGASRELVLDMGALPPRPIVRFELVSGRSVEPVLPGPELEIVECRGDAGLGDPVDLTGFAVRDIFFAFFNFEAFEADGTRETETLREGVHCRVRYTCPAARRGCCKLRVSAQSAPPGARTCRCVPSCADGAPEACRSGCSDVLPPECAPFCSSNCTSAQCSGDSLAAAVFLDPQCTTGSVRSDDFVEDGSGFRWLDDGSRRDTGTCEFSESGASQPVVRYQPSDPPAPAGWDCCTWRFEGTDGIVSEVGQVVYRNDAAPPPPDADGDGILDACDNCPQKPNGPKGGSCVAGKLGAACASDAACGTGGRCSLDQDDRNEDAQGDACTPPGVWKCAGEQLKAAAALCKAQLGCEAAFTTQGDPALRDGCLADTEASYGAAYAKALGTAGRAGAMCALDAEPATFLGAFFATPLVALGDAVRAGADPASAGDVGQRAALLQAAGTLCSSAFKAESASALKEDLRKLAAARAAARTKFDADAQKAIAKGGGSYDGLTLGEIRSRVDALVDDFEELVIQGP